MEPAIKAVDLRAKRLTNGVKSHIGAALTFAQTQPDETEWIDLLDSFYNASKQLDDLYNEVSPIFSLGIPTPKKPIPCPPSLYTLPQLLSTTIAQEDANNIKVSASTLLSQAEEKEVAVRLSAHNSSLDELIASYNAQIDAWKKVSRKKEQMAAAENRKRALKLQEEEAAIQASKRLAK